jgi:licheninase
MPDDHSEDLLVDDFEDGDQTTALGGNWYGYTDIDAGGGSLLGPQPWISAEGYQSSHGFAATYTLTKANYEWDPFIGVGASVTEDVSTYEGLAYWFRGPAHTVRFETTDVVDYDFFAFSVPSSSVWTEIKIPYVNLQQEGFGAAVPWDVTKLKSLSWHVVAPDGTTGKIELDDVYFEKSLDIVKGPPDLMISEPAPPPLNELDSIEIANPLQEKAMAELNRGYNLTNWLEDGRFDGFVYDETTVENLAAAGFRALRLPIDLDLYVTESSGSGDELSLTLHEDLFTILDSFDEWTAAHGLSLTIDYHQYDGSLALGDPASVDEVVALWRAVAAHFKDSARTDLYFELMNEPELSSGVPDILPTMPWTDAATRIISAIRAEDTTHTIIFGDVNWYGIDQLAARTPFSDDNIVYAFHFYDPFIFTHQGASWANMATTRKIPYPYSPERWSEYSSDLGLSKSNAAWIWDQFRNYYKNGSRQALYNRIALAKAWGVTNDVPVICNEFGAYDRSALREDLVRYYGDVIGIFEELEIPWTHWFMILQEDGTVADDYVQAFRLAE